MTQQEKKELYFVMKTAFKLIIGIIIIFAAAVTIANYLN